MRQTRFAVLLLPVSLLLAHLAAVFHRLGHQVEYAEDRMVQGADLYVFSP